MNSWLHISPLFPLWIIILLLVAACFFIWKEVQRTHRFKIVRIIAQILVVISIAGVLLRPSVRKQRRGDAILVLTPGYSSSQADSILQKNGNMPVYRTPGAAEYSHSQALTSYTELIPLRDRIKFITGYGLPSASLPLQSTTIDFIPAALPEGIIELHTPRPAKIHQRNMITGRVQSAEKCTLVLKGPGLSEDSVTMNSSSPFTLSFTPKEAGKYLYTLQWKNKNGLRLEEQIPVEVAPTQKIRMLFLQQFPSFETKYLKNFLAEQGHPIVVRQQVSKTNYRYEYANTSREVIKQLTASLLASFDLILIDSDMLDKLTPSEITALRQAVRKGLGVVILFNNIPSKVKSLQSLTSFQFKAVTSDTIHLASRSEKYVLPIQPETLISNPALIVVSATQGKILSAYQYEGLGKIAVQSVRETFSILLRGDKETYAWLWTPLLEVASRNQRNASEIKVESPIPIYANDPIHLSVISENQNLRLKQDSLTLPVMEDVTIDGLWHGDTWADKTGWHQFTIPSDSASTNFYISQPGEWSALRAANQVKENSIYFAGGKSSLKTTEQYTEPLSPVLFFILFLLASGFLWLAPKL